MVKLHGVRVFTPAAFFHKIPVYKTVLKRAEWFARSRAPLSRFGGFLVLEVRRAG